MIVHGASFFVLVFLAIHKFTAKEEAPYLCQIRFVSQSAFTHQRNRLIIEVTPLGGLAFIWLPSASQGVPEVRFVDPINKPIGKIITFGDSSEAWYSMNGIKSDRGAAISYVESGIPIDSHVANCSSISFMPDILVETTLDGMRFEEPHAFITSIESSDRNSITELSYRLIDNELPSILGSVFAKKFRGQQINISGNRFRGANMVKILRYARLPDFEGIHLSRIRSGSLGITWNQLYEV